MYLFWYLYFKLQAAMQLWTYLTGNSKTLVIKKYQLFLQKMHPYIRILHELHIIFTYAFEQSDSIHETG